MLVTLNKIGEADFRLLGTNGFHVKAKNKRSTAAGSQNLKTKISCRHLADFIEKLHQKACQACSIIIFPHSAIQITDLLRCRCHCRRHFLNSLFFAVQAAQICNLFPENSLTGFNPKTDQNKTKRTNITRKNGKKLAHRRNRSEIFCW